MWLIERLSDWWQRRRRRRMVRRRDPFLYK